MAEECLSGAGNLANPKRQTPNAKKIPMIQIPNLGFGNLRFLWRLEFGVWDFRPTPAARVGVKTA
jgi:hypothetical protein